jgi:hypothetical protein
MGYTSTTLPHLGIEHKELDGDFRFLPRVSNGLTSFLSPGLSTISFRTSKQFIVFRVVYFTCLKITVSWNTSEGTVCKNQEVSGRSLWLVRRYEQAYRLTEIRKSEQKTVRSLTDWNLSLVFFCCWDESVRWNVLGYSRYFEPHFIRRDRPRILSCTCVLNSVSFTT